MSSSGLIYAVIVGAWAVYLVPMWLRREDELNRARQTQRYAAAIKVLSNKEAFERRWAKSEGSVELPIAVGQNTAAPVARETKPAQPRKRVAAASAPVKQSVTATAASARADAKSSRPRPSAPAAAPAPAPATSVGRARAGLMARRRRVVAMLFGLSSLGALVTADLGAGYLWAMAVPAALLSTYIVRLRRDERAKVSERARRRAVADAARATRDAEARARAQAKARAEADSRAEAELEAFEHRQAQAVARRRSAAARARAQSYTAQDSAALRRTSNG